MPPPLLWALLILASVLAGGFIVAWRRQRRELELLATLEADLTAERARRDEQLVEKAGAMRTQSDLLAVVCREVRSHLDGIIGSADLVLETQLQPAQRTQLVTLKTTGESLLYLLNDLQGVSQAEYRAASGERQTFELRQEMAQVIEVLAPRAMLKGLEIVLLVQPDVPRSVQGDAALMRQFFFNLLACVLRPASPGALVIAVSRSSGAARPAPPSQAWFRFAVTAPLPLDGAEAPGSQSPFAVLDNLPLTIARRLTEVLGGDYGEARGPDAVGASFWFDIPLAGLAARREPRRPDAAAGFLVIWDDLPAARVALSDLLTEMGLDFDLALNAREAVEGLVAALEENDGDVMLLLDESIPPEEVRFLADAIASRPVLQPIKVILMSLRPEKAVLVPGLPICAILPKPVLLPRDLQLAMESARSTAALAPVTEMAFSQPPYPQAAGSGPAVLLVEDDEVSSQVNATVLKRLGCRVDPAGDGLTAVTLTKRRQYDVIFMDCHMPRLNGFKAATRIRALLGAKAPPIIALTAENSLSVRAQATESGMSDYLLKPANRAEFQRMLDKWAPGARHGIVARE